MVAIELDHLVVDYGGRRAVDGLSFSVEAGQVLALLGPNGAGKTTTVETLEGYRSPTSGTVRVLGLHPASQHRELVRRMGVMLQRGGVYPRIGARQALRLFSAYYPDPLDPDALLERLGLREIQRTPYRRLSGGEQQRLSLALALVGRPDVAFLDEPTAGVDPGGRLVIREVVQELAERGAAVLITTHELEEAERIADQVVIIDSGRLIAAGSPAELTTGGGRDRFSFGAPHGIDVRSLALALGAPVEESRPGEYSVRAPATPDLVAALTAWLADRQLPLADLRAGRASLEDVFLRLTGHGSEGEEVGAAVAGPRSRSHR